MVVTIEDRRVTQIPIEIESQLVVEPRCFTCGKTDREALRKCSNCKFATYCSQECQAQDFWERHKKEDECVAIKKLRQRLDKAESSIRANKNEIAQFYANTYGFRFTVRLTVQEDIFELIAGRFGDDPYTLEYMTALGDLMSKIQDRACHHQTPVLWEELLELALEMRRLTQVSFPDMVDKEIVGILVKLHREDDAISYIRYWTQWHMRPEELQEDPKVRLSSKGDYPYPCTANCRLDNITPCIQTCLEAMQEERMSSATDGVFIACCMASLVIKLRHVTVYRNLAVRAEVFLDSTIGQWIPTDVGKAIVSFLTRGDEGAAICAEQVEDVNLLMNFIDQAYPKVLPAVLDHIEMPPPLESPHKILLMTDPSADAQQFLGRYGDGAPVMTTLKGMLEERYA